MLWEKNKTLTSIKIFDKFLTSLLHCPWSISQKEILVIMMNIYLAEISIINAQESHHNKISKNFNNKIKPIPQCVFSFLFHSDLLKLCWSMTSMVMVWNSREKGMLKGFISPHDLMTC